MVCKVRKLCVVAPSMHGAPGGAEAVAAWCSQALLDCGALSVATPDRNLCLKEIDRKYGTSLGQYEESIRHVSLPGLRTPFNEYLELLHLALFLRRFQYIADNYDLAFGVINEIPKLACRSVQYIHCPARTHRLNRATRSGVDKLIQHLNLALFHGIAGPVNPTRSAKVSYVANSAWTADLFNSLYVIRPRVIYPPALVTRGTTAAGTAKWRNGILCIGRLRSDKLFEEAIAVTKRLWEKDSTFHLNIVGEGDGPYADRIMHIADTSPYVTLHRDVSRRRLTELLQENTYGLHMRREEHFGLAPAEMVSAGLIVLVHDSGGQREVVGERKELLFKDVDEASDKLMRLVQDKKLRDELVKFLRKHSELFHPDRFCVEVRQIVAACLNQYEQ